MGEVRNVKQARGREGWFAPAPVKESTYLREQRGQATLPDHEPASRITHHSL